MPANPGTLNVLHEEVVMKQLLVSVIFGLALFGCTPREVYRVQTFSPIMIDMVKIAGQDYQQLIDAVNTNYAPESREYVDARFLREENMFLYFHVYSGKNNSCYRVTVDRNRSKIVNIQPDCPVDVD